MGFLGFGYVFLTTGLLLGFLLGVPNLGPNNAPTKSEPFFLERFFRLSVFCHEFARQSFPLSRPLIIVWSSWERKNGYFIS